jgi:hypothetical protein
VLVFGDLGVRNPDLGSERLAVQPGLAGETTAQGDGEAAPQFRAKALNKTALV